MNWSRLSRFFRSPRFPIFMIVFVDVLGLGITLPVIPLFAQNQLGAQAWQITMLTSIYFTAQFFASPVLGRLSDRFGRRPVLIISQAGTLTALLMNGLAPTLLFLYLSRVIDGLTGGNISVAQAYLSDITDEKNRARGLGLVNAAFGLGFIFGPAFGGLVAAQFGPRVPFFIAAVFSLTTILLSTFLLPETLTPERRKHEEQQAKRMARGRALDLLRIPAVLLILFIAFGSMFSFFTFQTVYVLWTERLIFPGASQAFVTQAVGLIAAMIGIPSIITQIWLVGPFVRRFGELRVVIGGSVTRTIVFAAIASVPSIGVLLIALPFLAISNGVALPAIVALLTYAAPPNGRGQVIGLYQSAAALGSIVGPLLAGFLFQNIDPDAPMFAAAIIMGLTVLVGLNLFRMPLHKPRMVTQPLAE